MKNHPVALAYGESTKALAHPVARLSLYLAVIHLMQSECAEYSTMVLDPAGRRAGRQAGRPARHPSRERKGNFGASRNDDEPRRRRREQDAFGASDSAAYL